MTAKPENWGALTPDEKRAWRLEQFRTSGEGVKFVSETAKENYNTRVQRLIDVYNVKEPDRVPVNLSAGNLAWATAGVTTRTAFYEPEKAMEAAIAFNSAYAEQIEAYTMPQFPNGLAMDVMGYRLYAWPGHGLSDNAGGLQFIEGEYITADEYDNLIHDPSYFWLHKYLPRCFLPL